MWDFIASSSYAWLLLLGGFMIVNWLATTAAHDVLDPSRQYAGLFGMAAAEALIFAPFLHYFFEVQPNGDSTVVAAALITAVGFAGLTGRRVRHAARPVVPAAAAAVGRRQRPGADRRRGAVRARARHLVLGGDDRPGRGSILYQTQTIIRRYPAEAYVGASVQLFASVMLLFWYVLRLVGQLRS